MAAYEPQSGHELQSGPRGNSSLPDVHPAWQVFMRFCRQLRYGEIDQLNIQDGLPLLAEMTKKKVKFS